MVTVEVRVRVRVGVMLRVRVRVWVTVRVIGGDSNYNAQSCWIDYQTLRSPAGLY